MIRSIRELKKQMHDRLREEQIERDEEGRAVVKMTVLRDEDFLSDFYLIFILFVQKFLHIFANYTCYRQ